jgi:asparagine synthase (glutamine-hydrolysing)
MASALTHRGPDDAGVWVDEEKGLALSHRRLAIVDLSPAGHQPMASSTKRYWLIFNGEIYNHLALREQLTRECALQSPWRGHSDTETLLACIEAWGLEATLKVSIGMFALALWDSEQAVLSLARDRMGEKPLYFGWVQGNGMAKSALKTTEQRFAFASELKALRALDGFANPISRRALALFLARAYVPAPYAIYEGIFKLPPGMMLRLPCCALQASLLCQAPLESLFQPASNGSESQVSLKAYWSLHDAWHTQAAASASLSQSQSFPPQSPYDPSRALSEAQATDALDQLLRNAIGKQMLADVPLGAFLSGGVDSSTVVALMQAQSPQPIKTFTIGFDEAGFDESPYAQAVAKHLGTEHRSLIVRSDDARAVIAKLPSMYDEPFADSSQIPTHLVSQLARSQVTVSLSGDGGDELFGGYNRYLWTQPLWGKIGWAPYAMRQVLGKSLEAIPIAAWDRGFGAAALLRGGKPWLHRPGDKIHKMAQRLRYCENFDQFAQSFEAVWPAHALPLQGLAHPSEDRLASVWPIAEHALPQDPIARLMAKDSMAYLPDDILCKVDRAAMAVSLETRVPFLDHRVVEFAWQLPQHFKIRNGQGKWILRQVLYRYVPKSLIERPKAGFGIPVGAWLRGPLRAWAEDLLDPRRLGDQGYLDPKPIHAVWQEHLSGRHDHTPKLWTILMFQAWLEHQAT